MKKTRTYLFGLLLALCAGSIQAQDLDPSNPPEPFTYYKVTVSAEPYGYAYGAGRYMLDTQVNIRTSAYSGYTFSHWTKNGEMFSTNQSFTYTVDGDKAEFVAHYDYTPINPQEPYVDNRHRLFLINNIQEACSFNMSSGSKVYDDSYIFVKAFSNIGYDFLGWYENGIKVCESESFNYLMGTENVTLEARYEYNPINPDEPTGNGPQEKGDVNGDGIIDMVDVVALTNIYLGRTTDYNLRVCDMNNDGVVDMVDVVSVTNIYLNKN